MNFVMDSTFGILCSGHHLMATSLLPTLRTLPLISPSTRYCALEPKTPMNSEARIATIRKNAREKQGI